MEPAIVREILLVQHRAFTRDVDLVRRDVLDALPQLIPLPHVVIISGMRRAGKSTVLREIKDEFYRDRVVYYCNFEDERFLKFTVDDFQVLHGWERKG